MNEIRRGPVMSFLDVQYARPFKFILPPVYRYLPEIYAKAFFDSGALRLSSFKAFRKHTDEARQDEAEGTLFQVHVTNGARSFTSAFFPETFGYVLCASTRLSKAVCDDFSGASAAIEVTNLIGFAGTVADQIGGFVRGVSGACIYGSRRGLTRLVQHDPLPLPPDGGDIDVSEMHRVTDQGVQDEEHFVKLLRYQSQSEYRFIWFVDREGPDFLDIVFPQPSAIGRIVTREEIDEW